MTHRLSSGWKFFSSHLNWVFYSSASFLPFRSLGKVCCIFYLFFFFSFLGLFPILFRLFPLSQNTVLYTMFYVLLCILVYCSCHWFIHSGLDLVSWLFLSYDFLFSSLVSLFSLRVSFSCPLCNFTRML